MNRIGIIGNGVAAITAAREIRKQDESVNIDIFTDERHYYYPRPKLLEYISGQKSEEQIVQYDKDWYDKQNINLHQAEPVLDLVIDSKSILTQSNSYFNYDKILIAVGSNPFVPPIHGADKRGVFVSGKGGLTPFFCGVGCGPRAADYP